MDVEDKGAQTKRPGQRGSRSQNSSKVNKDHRVGRPYRDAHEGSESGRSKWTPSLNEMTSHGSCIRAKNSFFSFILPFLFLSLAKTLLTFSLLSQIEKPKIHRKCCGVLGLRHLGSYESRFWRPSVVCTDFPNPNLGKDDTI